MSFVGTLYTGCSMVRIFTINFNLNSIQEISRIPHTVCNRLMDGQLEAVRHIDGRIF